MKKFRSYARKRMPAGADGDHRSVSQHAAEAQARAGQDPRDRVAGDLDRRRGDRRRAGRVLHDLRRRHQEADRRSSTPTSPNWPTIGSAICRISKPTSWAAIRPGWGCTAMPSRAPASAWPTRRWRCSRSWPSHKPMRCRRATSDSVGRRRWPAIVLPGCWRWPARPFRPARADEAARDAPVARAKSWPRFELADKRLTIELVAAEPQLDSPVAISWDADGRLYVAEMIDYPLGPTAGRIRLLEDRDGDGRYERATRVCRGVEFSQRRAGRAGRRVRHGRARPAVSQGHRRRRQGRRKTRRVHRIWRGQSAAARQRTDLGLDNWIYGANGRSDGNVRRPNDPPEKAVSIRARDFRFRPDGSQFEATSGQSQFGQAGDDWGNRFLSWNTIPIRQAAVRPGVSRSQSAA